MNHAQKRDLTWVVLAVFLVFVVLSGGLLGNVVPQKISTTHTNCTLISKSYSNVSEIECNKSLPYVIVYFVTIKDQFGVFQVCSADSDPCGGGGSGPYVCHSLRASSLAAYNMMHVNQTYLCYFNHKSNYVFLYYDPTNYLQSQYAAGLAFVSLSLCCGIILTCLWMNWFWKQCWQAWYQTTQPEGEPYTRIAGFNPGYKCGEKEGGL